MTALGWLPDEFDAADWVLIMELFDYWAQYPPTHILMRGFVGYEGGAVPGKLTEAESQFLNLHPSQIRPASTLPPGVLEGLTNAVLEVQELKSGRRE